MTQKIQIADKPTLDTVAENVTEIKANTAKQTSVEELVAEVETLKTEITSLESTVENLKTLVNTVNTNVNTINTNVANDVNYVLPTSYTACTLGAGTHNGTNIINVIGKGILYLDLSDIFNPSSGGYVDIYTAIIDGVTIQSQSSTLDESLKLYKLSDNIYKIPFNK